MLALNSTCSDLERLVSWLWTQSLPVAPILEQIMWKTLTHWWCCIPWPMAVQYSTTCALNTCLALQVASGHTLTQNRQDSWQIAKVDRQFGSLMTVTLRRLCRAFNNSIHAAVQTTHAAMDAMLFKEALKHSFFGLLNARNLYLQRCGKRGIRRDLARRYMEVGRAPLWCSIASGTRQPEERAEGQSLSFLVGIVPSSACV